ncbi:hypothetical protein BCV52_26610 [Priestia aryabhattai]|nr:hypothetical protein BCV52_26610 [Priestia aryabhattai]
MDIIKIQSWSLYADFIDLFSHINYRGFPIVLFCNFQRFLNHPHVKNCIESGQLNGHLKNEILKRNQIQPKFDKIMNSLIVSSTVDYKTGKIALFDEINLRFNEDSYLQNFDESTTVILRKSPDTTKFLGIPVHSLGEYKTSIKEVENEIYSEIKKVFTQNQTHPFFKLQIVNKRFYEEINDILEWLPAIINYFDNNKISCVILGGAGESFSRMLITVAKTKGIPSICMQHAMMGADRGWLPTFATKEAVYSNYEKTFFLGAGVPEDRIEIIGHPKYDIIFNKEFISRKLFCEKLGFDHRKQVILLATQPMFWDLNFIKTLVASLLKHQFQIIIKPHPTELKSSYIKENWVNLYQQLAEKSNSIKLIVDNLELYDILANVDIVCLHYSTVGLEAGLFEKPTIYTAKNQFDGPYYDYCNQLVATTPIEIAKLAFKICKNNKYKLELQNQQKQLILEAYKHKFAGLNLSNLIHRMTGIISSKNKLKFPNGTLVKGTGVKIFIIENGLKRHIPSPVVFAELGFNPNDILIINDNVLETIPNGPQLEERV